MRTIIILILFSLPLPAALKCQIQQQIDFAEETYMMPEGFGGHGHRPFLATFVFESLPQPLQVTRVNYTLRVPLEKPWRADADWVIKVAYPLGAIRLLSDSVMIWRGPHELNDVFTGTLEFVIVRSGFYKIMLYSYQSKVASFFYLRGGVSFGWSFSLDGKLLFLDKVTHEIANSECTFTYFFGPDSVVIGPHYFEKQSGLAFDYSIIIKPIPRIGDTCIFYYRLISERDLPTGCVPNVMCAGMRLTNYPERLDRPIREGEVIRDSLLAIPAAFRDVHSLNYDFVYNIPGEPYPRSQVIPLEMVFANDSALKYVGALSFIDPDSILTSIFPPRDPQDDPPCDVDPATGLLRN